MAFLDLRFLTRLAFFVLALLIIGGSLLYSNYLARQLARKEQQSVELYAKAQELIARPAGGEDLFLGFVFEYIVLDSSGAVPRMLIGESGRIDAHNLRLPYGMSPADSAAWLERKLEQLKGEYPPIEVEFAPGRSIQVAYGESDLLRQLRWFPLAQLLAAFLFIALAIATLVSATRSEQNRVWVGMAKETAHQLGTPVSSLMAWVELLRDSLTGRGGDLDMLDEMERDLRRLETIAERFSKIGSQPELSEVSLRQVLDHSAEYLQKRMTRSGSIRLALKNQIPLDSQLQINPQLFDWVIENLLKNALDAIQSREGLITIEAGDRGAWYYIDVTDTGKGIPKGHFRKVFEPGFTTKKRGWGLGLSLSRRIIESYHRGRIFVRHSEPGKGTTFRILLPKGKRPLQRRSPRKRAAGSA